MKQEGGGRERHVSSKGTYLGGPMQGGKGVGEKGGFR